MATKQKPNSLFDFADTFAGLSDNQFKARIDKMLKPSLEELYLKAKDAYYAGNPIMSDPQFDYMENILKKMRSAVTSKVGGKDSNKNLLVHKHKSPFLSLEKVQVNDENQFFDNVANGDENVLNDLLKWSNNTYPLEATPKFDGNAIELQYDNGKLTKAITRGEDNMGADITGRLSLIVPTTISSTKSLEIRGEVVMPVDVFKSQYPDKANPRNTVAGILNPKNDDFETGIRNCVFVAYSIKAHDSNRVLHVEDAMSNLSKLGFNKSFPVLVEIIKSASDFKRIYEVFKNYRAGKCPFQLDGIVVKMPESIRGAIGETNHHPKWAIAIKFPSKEAITKIVDIEWNVGYTGEFAPTAILEAVDLDGSEVKRASVYNKSKIESLGTFPGAVVAIKKSGDIIPQIIRIEKRSPNEAEFKSKQNFYPKVCSCGSTLSIEQEKDTVHIWCHNRKCPDVNIKKLALGISALKIKNIGESTCRDLYKAGIENIFDFFDNNKMNAQSLVNTGVFKPGRSLELILEAVDQFDKVDLWKVVLCLMVPGLGDTGSKQVAKMVAGNKYSFDGLDSKVMSAFTNTNSVQYQSVVTLIKILRNRGVNIVTPVEIASDAITFEMTGSPSDAGYKTKEELVSFLASKGFAHTKLKDAKLLLTDSHSATSSKMKDAKKKGIKIMTYEELIKTL